MVKIELNISCPSAHPQKSLLLKEKDSCADNLQTVTHWSYKNAVFIIFYILGHIKVFHLATHGF